MMKPHSLYFHVPFCSKRCSYCDFTTYAGIENLIPGYVEALISEIRFLATNSSAPIPVPAIYFGGGTPSLLSPGEIERLLQEVGRSFNLHATPEITLEANPGTLSRSYLTALRGTGVNRLSIGMQSAQPEELTLLGRTHTYKEVVKAVNCARRDGFKNLSLDLIYGLPSQTLDNWEFSLNLALDLRPEHISLYALSVEPGTPLHDWIERGLLSEPDPDMTADLYELAVERLSAAGYQQYEISNWALSDGEGALLSCVHNLRYWRNQDYLGMGAGAHGYSSGVRTVNVASPSNYIQRLTVGGASERDSHSSDQASMFGDSVSFPCTPVTEECQPIDRETEMSETLMMGLRLTQEGVSRTTFEARFGVTLEAMFSEEITELVGYGLLEWGGVGEDILRLTPTGRLLGNQVFMRFL